MDREKLYDILMSDDVVDMIKRNLNIILILIPELKDMIGFEHKHPHHHLDVWNHTLLALSYSSLDFDVRLALLLHDIGKPHSYQDGEVRHFRGHPKMSAEMSHNILNRLQFEEDEINKIYYLIKEHDSPITDEQIHSNYQLSLLKFKIQCCDALAHNPCKLEKRIKYLLNVNKRLNIENEKNEYMKLILKFCK